MHYTSYDILHALYIIQYTPCIMHHTIYSMHYTSTSYNILHALYKYTIRYTPYNIHHTTYIIHASIMNNIGQNNIKTSTTPLSKTIIQVYIVIKIQLKFVLRWPFIFTSSIGILYNVQCTLIMYVLRTLYTICFMYYCILYNVWCIYNILYSIFVNCTRYTLYT